MAENDTAIEVVLAELDKLEEYKKIAELTKISCCTAQNCEALNNAIKEGLENQKLKVELDNKDKIINEMKNKLNEHIKFCEQEANGSLNNEICHISLKFDKSLLDIIES